MTCSSQHPCTGFSAVLYYRIAGRHLDHLDAAIQTVLALHHDGVAGLQSLLDQRTAIEGFADRHSAQLRRAVRADDVDLWALWALLQGAQRHGDRVVLLPEDQPHVDEFAGPKGSVRIGKGGLKLDGA